MCGIVGCVTPGLDAPRLLVDGLRRLEYRGYDSAGVAVIQNGEVVTLREVGKLKNLEDSLRASTMQGGVGLGHTRWATHGRPTQVNAHPHRDSTGRIVVVHNGIIENFRELRAELERDGTRFESETDSEVIAHLVRAYFDGDLLEAVRRAALRLRGAWAIGVLNADTPDLIIGARRDCPLVIGVGEGGNLLASDVTAVLSHTRRVVFLDDGHVAELRRDTIRIVDADGVDVDVKPTTIEWSLAQAERGGYPHFMLKEIHEQPTVISDTLLGRLDETTSDIRLESLGLDAATLASIDRVQIIACGTSWHAGHVGKFLIERLARLSVDVDYASEFRYRSPVFSPHGLVIAISQSGETADTIAALRMAKQAGCRTIGICNVVGSTIAREANGLVMTHAGPEIGVASTKAFTSQLIALILLAMRLGRVRGRLDERRFNELARGLRELPAHVESVLRQADQIRDIARRFATAQDFLFIGRGLNYPIALEGALKLKEISYIHAEGYPAGEMKHGPIALVDERMPIVAICTRSEVADKVLTNVEEARVRDAKVIVIGHEGDAAAAAVADEFIAVPETDELLGPVINVVPLQLLAYFAARERGCDVDQPRNLAKSVTVE